MGKTCLSSPNGPAFQNGTSERGNRTAQHQNSQTYHLYNEEAFLLQHKQAFLESDPPLSHQLCLHRLKLIQSNNLHIRRLEKLASLPGFCGTIVPGTALDAAIQPPDSLNWPTPQEHTGGEEAVQDFDPGASLAHYKLLQLRLVQTLQS